MVTAEQIRAKEVKVALVGLGYVGRPLAAAFGRKADVIGLDISAKKIEERLRGRG